jgi:hypothetical protein
MRIYIIFGASQISPPPRQSSLGFSHFGFDKFDDLANNLQVGGFDCRGVPPSAGLRARYRARAACPYFFAGKLTSSLNEDQTFFQTDTDTDKEDFS